MKSVLALLSYLVAFGGFLHAADLPVVEKVDLDRYLGTWYEVARYPFSIQEGCHNTTATYSLMENGHIQVKNVCRKGSFGGRLSVAKGQARVVDPDSKAKLQVNFFFLAPWADYWIIALGDQYDYAVISQPSRKYLWILSRTPRMEESLYQEILAFLDQHGFERERILKTPQQWGPL